MGGIMKRTIAIAIPTFNRGKILEENLNKMLPFLSFHSIPVYISDDSNNELTYDMVMKLQVEYPNIIYTRNVVNLGHDKNCLKTLMLPTEDYIWYLGDSQIISKGYLGKVLELLEYDYSFIVGSSEGRVIDVDSREYNNGLDFFEDLAWHATLTGVTIYKREILNFANYEKYYDSNFIQLGIILEEMIDIRTTLYYLNEPIIVKNSNKEISYWSTKVFSVFAKDWTTFILSLPNYYEHNKKISVIKSHSIHTNIFGHDNFVNYRKKGIFDLNEYIKYHKFIRLTSSIKMSEVFLILVIPRWLYKFKDFVRRQKE